MRERRPYLLLLSGRGAWTDHGVEADGDALTPKRTSNEAAVANLYVRERCFQVAHQAFFINAEAIAGFGWFYKKWKVQVPDLGRQVFPVLDDGR